MLQESSDEPLDDCRRRSRRVLAARLDQLDPDERTVLEAAAVEGEVFHARRGPGAHTRRATTDGAADRARPQGVRPPRPPRVRRRGRIPLPPPAAPRRDLRRHPESRTLGPARALRRLARAARPTDSTRSSATTSNRPTDSGASSAAPTPSSAPARAGCSGRQARKRSAEPTCPRRSRSSSGRARCSHPTRRRSSCPSSARHSSKQAGSRRPTASSPRRSRRAEADPLLESRARVEQQFVRLHAESGGDDRRGAPESRPPRSGCSRSTATTSASAGPGACEAWIEWTEGHSTAADEAWQRAATHAERPARSESCSRSSAGAPRPRSAGRRRCAEAIETCTEILEQVRSSPVAVAVTLHPLAALHAMRGEFDEARSLVREGTRSSTSRPDAIGGARIHEALVEMLAGNPREAAEQLHLGYERLEEMGEKALLATTAAMLAQALYAQERYDEAERFCSVSESTAAAEDSVTQVIWRGSAREDPRPSGPGRRGRGARRRSGPARRADRSAHPPRRRAPRPGRGPPARRAAGMTRTRPFGRPRALHTEGQHRLGRARPVAPRNESRRHDKIQ